MFSLIYNLEQLINCNVTRIHKKNIALYFVQMESFYVMLKLKAKNKTNHLLLKTYMCHFLASLGPVG